MVMGLIFADAFAPIPELDYCRLLAAVACWLKTQNAPLVSSQSSVNVMMSASQLAHTTRTKEQIVVV